MAWSNLQEAVREISRLQKENGAQQDRNQALEVENGELRDQLALAAGKKGKTDRADKSDQSETGS